MPRDARAPRCWPGWTTRRISYLNLHFLEHGSLAVLASDRVDTILLDAILQPAVTIAARENGVTLQWLGISGRTYQLFTAANLAGPWVPGPTFSGTGSELVFTDPDTGGRARQFYQIRMW